MTKHCIDFRVMWCPHVQRKCHQLLGIVIVCHFHEIGVGGDVLDGPGGSETCTRVGVGSGGWFGGWLGGIFFLFVFLFVLLPLLRHFPLFFVLNLLMPPLAHPCVLVAIRGITTHHFQRLPSHQLHQITRGPTVPTHSIQPRWSCCCLPFAGRG